MARAVKPRLRQRWIAAAIIGSLLFTAGCTSSKSLYGMGVVEVTMEELESRPYLEEMKAKYDAMLEEMREAWQLEFPEGEWTTKGEYIHAAGGYSVDEAYKAFSPRSIFSVSFAGSEEDKQKVLRAVAPIAKKYGFSEPERYVEIERSVQLRSFDKYGAELQFGCQELSTLDYTTGPHLRNKS